MFHIKVFLDNYPQISFQGSITQLSLWTAYTTKIYRLTQPTLLLIWPSLMHVYILGRI